MLTHIKKMMELLNLQKKLMKIDGIMSEVTYSLKGKHCMFLLPLRA